MTVVVTMRGWDTTGDNTGRNRDTAANSATDVEADAGRSPFIRNVRGRA